MLKSDNIWGQLQQILIADHFLPPNQQCQSGGEKIAQWTLPFVHPLTDS